MLYADLEYYQNTFKGTDDITEKDLRQACNHVDSLTFNRIDVSELTDYQLNIIKESVCLLAEFEHENKDILNSPMDSYSLNGASVSYNGIKASVYNGVIIRQDIYSHLKKCGLCCGLL